MSTILRIPFAALLLGFTLVFTACSKEEDNEPESTENTDSTSDVSYTITVGVFILEGTTYTDQNKDLVFVTQDECQSWSRTAQSDGHDTESHDHFNAAKNTTYNADTETISWDEFGPELDQTSIDATCSTGDAGATKTANKTGYSLDKNFYLQIKTVVKN